jgi:outer membrane protein OmpA-like peptidoglycan-associated protein
MHARRKQTGTPASCPPPKSLANEKRSTDAARDDVDDARMAAADSAAQSAQQQQLDDLHARPTDQGLVLTLGDVLFTSGQADPTAGAATNLNKLAAFLTNYPDRNVSIEGHTDSVGGEDFNVGLSQRRADSVRNFLTGRASAPGDSRPQAKARAMP